MQLFTELQNLMVNYHFRPNRRMSQNFIVDKEILQKLVTAAKLKPTDTVLEIGAGTGFLTAALQKHCKVFAVEKDETLFELLESELPKENLTLIKGDFLELKLPEFNKIVSLPPYSISSEIIYKLIDSDFELAVLVFQNEFVQKLIAQPGFTDYSALTALLNCRCDIEIIESNIAPETFFPKPNAFSAAIRITPKKVAIEVSDYKKFSHFVKTLFRLKNKNLSNSLLKSYQFIKEDLKISEKELKEKISEDKIGLVKVYNLSPEQFAKLFKRFYKS